MAGSVASTLARSAIRQKPPKVECSATLYVGGVEVARRYQPVLKSHLDQSRALLILRQVVDAELVEKAPQVGLDRVEAHEQLVGDLLVGRRCRIGSLVLVWPA